MLDFWPSFCQSLAIIFVSEIADRTFILEVVYFPKIGAVPLLVTATIAMGLMDAIAISIGYLLPLILLREIVDWIGFAAFTLFGIFSFYDYFTMEKVSLAQEIEQETKEKDKPSYVALSDNETGITSQNNQQGGEDDTSDPGLIRKCAELFGFLCLSEIGDKSEIVTISIAALYDLLGVIAGTMLAYTVTCCIAIFLGSALGHCISEKQMCLVGGICFLFFAIQILLGKLGFGFF